MHAPNRRSVCGAFRLVKPGLVPGLHAFGAEKQAMDARTDSQRALRRGFRARSLHRLIQPEHQIGAGRPLARALHTLLLHRIVRRPDAGGVEQRQRPAGKIEMHLDDVACGARPGRDDRRLAPGDPVEQRRLAGVGRTGDGHHQPVTQPLAAAAVGQRRADLGFQVAGDRQRRCQQIVRHVGLVGKIDARVDQGERLNQPLPPRLGTVAEKSLELTQRLAALPFGFRHHQIGEALDGGEIELAVLEAAPGELAGLGRTQALDARQRGEHCGDHRAATVQLQFGDILAGLAVRAGKPQRQRLVDRLVCLRVAQASELGGAGRGDFAGKDFQRRAGARPGNADDGNRRRRTAGGEGEDGVAGGGHTLLKRILSSP